MKKVEAIGISIGNAGRKLGCEKAPYVLLNEMKDKCITDAQISNYTGEANEVEAMGKYFIGEAQKVSKLLDEDKFPLVLGGDHSCAIATWSGVYNYLKKSDNELGLIWVDAHLDNHRPETTHTGNIHGMPVAHLLGYGYQELKEILNSEPKLKPENIVFFGIRSFEEEERELLDELGVKIYYQKDLDNENFEETFLREFKRIAEITNGNVGISFDLDSLDPVRMDAVGTPVKDGISPEVFYDTIAKIDYSNLVCFEIAEYNPLLDKSGLSLEYMDKLLQLVQSKVESKL